VKPKISLRWALEDRNLLGNALPGDSWKTWRSLLIAAAGEALDGDGERAIFKKITKRDHEPGRFVAKLVACVGRRSGKSKAMATLVAYIAGRCDHSDVLEPGEVGTALCVALNVPATTPTIRYPARSASPMRLIPSSSSSATARSRTLRLTDADPIRNSLPPIPIMRRHF
jgi:hypothetical protein